MTAYDFSLVGNSSFAFDGDNDTISFGTIAAASLTITDDGTNTTITDGTTTVTLQGFRPFQIDTANFLFTGSSASEVKAGDNDNTTSTDDSSDDTITEAQANQNNLFIGFGGGDSITTGNGDVVVFGGSGIVDSDDGDDSIAGGTGSSVYYGNAGADTIDTFATANGKTATVYGGVGNDSVTTGAGAGNVVLYGNTGGDTLDASAQTGDATIFGGNGAADSADGDDSIAGGTGALTIYGNAGADTIDTFAPGASDTTTIYSGLGDDSVTSGAGAGNLVLYGNSGADVLNVASLTGDATIYGGNGVADSTDGNDTITTGDGASAYTVYGNAGDDSISTQGNTANQTATIFTGLGDDTVSIVGDDTTEVTVTLATGSEVVNYDGDTDTDQAQVTLSGYDGANDIVNITLEGADDAATLSFNTSTYTLTDDNSINIVFSGLATDFTSSNLVLSNTGTAGIFATNLFGDATTLTGGTGDDHLISGSNADTLNASTGNDVLSGNLGNDTFNLANATFDGSDTISGGGGTDIIRITDAATVVDNDFANVTSTEQLTLVNTGAQSVELGNAATSAGLTTIDASALTGIFTLTEEGGQDFTNSLTLTTGSGDDVLARESAGSDNIDMGSGDDTLTINTALLTNTDTIVGGSGTDIISIADAASLVDSDFRNVTTVETLKLGNAANTVTLGTEATEAGIVTIDASADATGGGTITATNMTVDLTFNGGAGNNTYIGGSGDDTFTGGAAADTFTGNGGSDHFDYDGAAALATVDVITAFVAGAGGDVYILDATAGAGAQLTAGNTVVLATAAEVQAAAAAPFADRVINDTLATTQATVNGTAGVVHYLYDTATGDLWYDDDGNWADAADQQQLSNVTTLTGTAVAANFEILA